MWELFGYLAAGFVLTGMTHQLFPDGRFPFPTILLVILLASGGAAIGHRGLESLSILTGGLLGAGLTSGLLFFLFDRTGWLAQEPWPTPPSEPEPPRED